MQNAKSLLCVDFDLQSYTPFLCWCYIADVMPWTNQNLGSFSIDSATKYALFAPQCRNYIQQSYIVD